MRSIVLFVAFSLLFALINAQQRFLNEKRIENRAQNVIAYPNTLLKIPHAMKRWIKIDHTKNCQRVSPSQPGDVIDPEDGLLVHIEYDGNEYTHEDATYNDCEQASKNIIRIIVHRSTVIDPIGGTRYLKQLHEPVAFRFQQPSDWFLVADPRSDCSIRGRFSDNIRDVGPLPSFHAGTYYFSDEVKEGRLCEYFVTLEIFSNPPYSPPSPPTPILPGQGPFLNEHHISARPGKYFMLHNTFLKIDGAKQDYIRINRENDCQHIPEIDRQQGDVIFQEGMIVLSQYRDNEYTLKDANPKNCEEADSLVIGFNMHRFIEINSNGDEDTFEVKENEPIGFVRPSGWFLVSEPQSDCSISRQFSQHFRYVAPLKDFEVGTYHFSNVVNENHACDAVITLEITALPPGPQPGPAPPSPTVSGAGGLYAISLVALIASSLIAMIALF